MPHNTKQIRPAYKSKHSFKRESKVILLMITDGKKWHYLAVKSLSALLRRIASNHKEDFYCLNCFHSYSTKNKLKTHERVCNDHDYCYVEMPNEDNKILKYNHGEKSLKVSFMIYADLEYLLEKMHSCQNNLEISYTEKKAKYTPSGYSLFCKDLRDHAMKIINYEEKEIIPLTNKESKSYEKQKVCYICKKEFSTHENDKNAFKLYDKVRDHCHYTGKYTGVAHSICNLRCKTPKVIPVVFHNGFTFDNHFIIKQLAKEFDGQFECSGENAEKYITFSVSIKKELDNSQAITCKLKFMNNLRFINTSISDLVGNLSEIYKKGCKGCEERRKIKTACDFIGLKNNKLNYECKEYKERWLKPIN